MTFGLFWLTFASCVSDFACLGSVFPRFSRGAPTSGCPGGRAARAVSPPRATGRVAVPGVIATSGTTPAGAPEVRPMATPPRLGSSCVTHQDRAPRARERREQPHTRGARTKPRPARARRRELLPLLPVRRPQQPELVARRLDQGRFSVVACSTRSRPRACATVIPTQLAQNTAANKRRYATKLKLKTQSSKT